MSVNELSLLKEAFLFRPTKVMVLKNIALPQILGSTLVKGTEVPIPLWLAQILEANGYIEIQDKMFTPADITKTRFLQQQHRDTPIKLDDFFYITSLNSIKSIEKTAREQGDFVLTSAIERAKQDVFDLFKMRLSSIFKAIQLMGLDSIEKNLSVEEKLIAKAISMYVKKFIDELIPLI